jgi:hypothetical protein
MKNMMLVFLIFGVFIAGCLGDNSISGEQVVKNGCEEGYVWCEGAQECVEPWDCPVYEQITSEDCNVALGSTTRACGESEMKIADVGSKVCCVKKDVPVIIGSEDQCDVVCDVVGIDESGCLASSDVHSETLNMGPCIIKGSGRCANRGQCYCFCLEDWSLMI